MEKSIVVLAKRGGGKLLSDSNKQRRAIVFICLCEW